MKVYFKSILFFLMVFALMTSFSFASNVASSVPLHSGDFIFNKPDEAIQKASHENKPLIISFYGIWCPPCNMLDEEVFASKEFSKAVKNFVALKLDADNEISFPLKSKYKVGGYPTVVFTTPKGEEISRFVGFKGKKSFLKMMQTALENKVGTSKSPKMMAATFLEREEWDKALEILKSLPQTNEVKEQFYFAKVGLVEKAIEEGKKTSDDLLAAYKESIAALPNAPISMNDRLEAAKLTKDKKDKELLLNQAIEQSLYFQKNPQKLEGTEYTIADAATFEALSYAELGDAEKEKRAWQKSADAYTQLMKKSAGKLKRGYLLEQAYCLRKSGKVTEAEKIYLEQQRKFSNEFTFYFAHAAMLLEQKKLKEALEKANQALVNSYGDNRLRVVELVAKIEEAAGEKEKAVAAIKEELEKTKVSSELKIRTHRYINKLKAMLERLEKAV